MPYKKNLDLPADVRKNLPYAAQTIFRKTFNSAYKQYKNEVQVFKIAWASVKKTYKKDVSNKWVKKIRT